MKCILITGSSSGFGFDLVQAFLEKGWRVVATLRHMEERRALFEVLARVHGERLVLRELDVTKRVDQDAIVSEGFELDAVIQNAGFGVYGAFEDTDETQMRAQFETNVFSVLTLSQKLLPSLRRNKGHLIIVGSVAGRLGVPLGSLYCASKFALEGWAESLWYEVRRFGVRVTLVEPGQFRTSFGQNIHYAAGFDHRDSVYFEMNQSFRRYRESRYQQKGRSSAEVISSIVDVAEQKNPPLRWVCGRDARAGLVLKRFLPESLFLRILDFVFKTKF